MKKLQITALLSVVMVAGLQASDVAAELEGKDSKVQVTQECLASEATAVNSAKALEELSLADRPAAATGVMVLDDEPGSPTKKTAEQAEAELVAADDKEAAQKEEAADVKPAADEDAL